MVVSHPRQRARFALNVRERQVRNLEVRGSIPLRSIEKAVKCLNFTVFLHLRSQDGDIRGYKKKTDWS